MKPIQFPEADMLYVSPKNWDVEKYGPCGNLFVHANNEEQTVMSCWEMTDEERGAWAMGAKLYLYAGVCYDGPREGQRIESYVRRVDVPYNHAHTIFQQDYDGPTRFSVGTYHWSAPLRKWVYEP